MKIPVAIALAMVACAETEEDALRIVGKPHRVLETSTPGPVATTYLIENRSAERVKVLSVSRSCSCADAAFDSRTIQPGEQAELRVVIEPVSTRAPTVATVTVRTDRGQTLLVGVEVRARNGVYLEPTQRRIAVSGLRLGRDREITIHLESPPPRPGWDLGLASTHPGLDLEHAEYSAPAGAYQCQLRIRWFAPGSHSLSARFSLATSTSVLALAACSILIEAEELLEVSDRELHLSQGKGTLDVRSPSLPAIVWDGVQGDIDVSVVTLAGDKGYRVHVGTTSQRVRGVLTVYLDDYLKFGIPVIVHR